MVEAGANQLPEQDVIEAIDFGYEAVGELIRAQLALLKELGIEQVLPEERSEDPALPEFLEKECAKGIGEVLKQFGQTKAERDEKLDAIKAEVGEKIAALGGEDPIKVAVSSNGKLLGNTYKGLTKKLMRQQIIVEGKRVDGRSLDEVRPIQAAVGVLPKRVHGTGLFQRGLTQVLSCATLGTPSDAQEMDDLNPISEKTYLHHYNFPLFGR